MEIPAPIVSWQISEYPFEQTATYQAAVYAIRYRLYTGWSTFTLPAIQSELKAEAARISAWLHRDWFATLAKRREFRRLYPACIGYTWPRIRNVAPPTADLCARQVDGRLKQRRR